MGSKAGTGPQKLPCGFLERKGERDHDQCTYRLCRTAGLGQLPGGEKFCAAVFGWTFTDYGPDYVAFEAAKIGGGVTNQSRQGVRAAYLHLTISRALRLLRAAGAEVINRSSAGRRSTS